MGDRWKPYTGAVPAADRVAKALLKNFNVQRGDRVGYGAVFTAEAAMRIGVVACGYADGYPRHAGSDTPVLVDGVLHLVLPKSTKAGPRQISVKSN